MTPNAQAGPAEVGAGGGVELSGTGFRFDAEASHDFMPTWVHESEPVWIREYEPVEGVHPKPNFYVYRSVHAPKRGQRPWAVDNRALFDKANPPHTLAAALEIATAAIAKAVQS